MTKKGRKNLVIYAHIHTGAFEFKGHKKESLK